jgi:hypothetical protein
MHGAMIFELISSKDHPASIATSISLCNIRVPASRDISLEIRIGRCETNVNSG